MLGNAHQIIRKKKILKGLTFDFALQLSGLLLDQMNLIIISTLHVLGIF